MSWNFYMLADLGGPEPKCVQDDLGYTSNVAPMFYDCIDDKNGIRSLNMKTGAECIPILRKAIDKMVMEPLKYERMNPDNAWGDYDGALKLLQRLLKWCIEAPNAIMRVS